MLSNVFVAPLDGQQDSNRMRLPVRTAALGIVALSLLGWLVVLAPIFELMRR